MRIVIVKMVVVAFLFLIACNNASSPAQSEKTNSEKSTEITHADKADDLTKYGIANNTANILGGLQIGERAPDFALMDQDGSKVSLSEKLMKGPVLMVFLRAEWCSFCRKHLQAFQDNLMDITASGQAQVIAVSPQLPEYMKSFHQKNALNYPILYDDNHSVMKDYKVFFHVTEKYNDYIKKAKGNSIEAFNGDKEPVMPIPATYLIGQDGIIKYVHYDPDYKQRSAMDVVMNAL